jgi:hypothetical protein
VLTGRSTERHLAELARVEGLTPNGDYQLKPLGEQP